MRDVSLIRLAYKKSMKSDHVYPMAAVLVIGNRVLSYGVNRESTHPLQLSRFYTEPDHARSIHAELAATLGTHKHCLDGSTLYVVRRLKNGDLGLSKPCSVCFEIISSCGIRRVVYSISGTIDRPVLGDISL